MLRVYNTIDIGTEMNMIHHVLGSRLWVNALIETEIEIDGAKRLD